MAKKYLIDNYWPTEINIVESSRETRHCIWVDGKRKVKKSKYSTYYDTYEEPFRIIYNRMKNDYDNAKADLDNFLYENPMP